MKKNITTFAILVVVAMLVVVPLASAAVGVDSTELRNAVEADNILDHLEVLEVNGPRVSGTSGYDAAAAYVYSVLDTAGYDVAYQEFTYDLWEELDWPVLDAVSPDLPPYPPYHVAGFATMEYSGDGDMSALVQPTVDIIIPPARAADTSTSGCEAEDFASFTPGNIALIQRGFCTFLLKAKNAEAAGASGVIIFNEGQEGRTDAFLGTLGEPVSIPVVGANYYVGEELYTLSLAGDVTVHMLVNAVTYPDIPTHNVIAETPGGRDDRVVVVGAHLDTVAAGPGINDNGSGVAMILEIAKQMAALGIEPRNKVRFAFWSAEESGLLGAEYYVNQLTKRERKNIALNLNFDMVASPNFVRAVYDGDGSDTPQAGPNGSGNIEDIFLDYFADQGLPVEATAFDGRSDYGPFIDVGIPAGGLFAGGDDIKTEEQAVIYGGTAGVYLDPCYHTPCDDLSNVNEVVLEEMSDAAAHAVLTFAMTTSSVNGTGKASKVAVENLKYKGPKAQR